MSIDYKEATQKIRELRNQFKETKDINDLNEAYKSCQEARAQGVDVSWYYPWVMYDYLKVMLEKKSVRGYFHTLDRIYEDGLLTNGKIPLDVQKNFVISVQNNICSMAWALRNENDFDDLIYLYERGIEYFINFDESLISNEDLFQRDKSEDYGKECFFETMLVTLFVKKDLENSEANVDDIIARFLKVKDYFSRGQIPYYRYLCSRILTAVCSMSWKFWKANELELLDKCAEAYIQLNLNLGTEKELRMAILPFIYAHKGAEKYSEEYPDNFIQLMKLVDFNQFESQDYQKKVNDSGKTQNGSVENILQDYLKTARKLQLSAEQYKTIIDKVKSVLHNHPDYTWVLYSYCYILISCGLYDKAQNVGLDLAKRNVNNPNIWALLGETYQDSFDKQMACLYMACDKGTMSDRVRQEFIEGLLKSNSDHSIIKREALRLKNKAIADKYMELPWFNDEQEASEYDQHYLKFKQMVTSILYADEDPDVFYVDWEDDNRYGLVVIRKTGTLGRYKIYKDQVGELKINQAYKAVLVVKDEKTNRIKFIGEIEEVTDPKVISKYLRKEKGIFNAVKDFGFIVNKKSKNQNADYYCNQQIVSENNLQNYDTVSFLAKKTYDKSSWKWRVGKILAVEKGNPDEYKKTITGIVGVKQNKSGKLYGFIDIDDTSCYVPGSLLEKAGIEYNPEAFDPVSRTFIKTECYTVTVLAEKRYDRKKEEWLWAATDIQEVTQPQIQNN